ncbi:long-chain fatty acid--CoA ligase [Novosphingobium sp. FKTRR1]|uniref:long-chain fatty acid--CoA ligase n=1 Tax=Novosphingobium sp. FKTRR1 TaxID=2879118 RepID=UPI001CF04649|nr:long-chain fatty acid--CoA ligase [Novosphingobium sp. FKTRR1]
MLMLLGAMQDWTLRVTHLIDHAAREHGGREIVSRWADGSESRTNWAGIRRDAMRMANALRALGIGQGERVATLAMNHHRHLITWYGAVGAGAVLHTVNPRLFDDQLDYIVNHAEDRVLLFDKVWAPIVERMKPRWPTIEHYICFDSDEPAPHFEDWIGGYSAEGAWAEGDERDPCMLCYTSGTTGNPKGVLYEHRSTMLHALTCLSPGVFGMDCRAVMMPIVPMFHAASWGLPWAGAAAGAKFVYSAVNDAAVLCDLFEREKVTCSAGVPTVWLSLLQHLDATGKEIPETLQQVVCGGSAMPRAMVERFMAKGIRVAHAWGMTETSPIGTTGCETWNWDDLSFEEQVTAKAMQGRVPFGVELRCVDLGDADTVLPRDGVTAGALQVRGPWVVKRYFKAERDATGADQWFDTGDVAVIHPDGTLQLTDRTKDVIKSGGEWISSVELENAAVGHPAVAEAAAIGIFHPKWDERPLLVVVRKPGSEVSEGELRSYLAQHVAKWCVPDAVAFVDEIPHTGTGKISKKDLRYRFRDYAWAA